jgi:beta-lactamase class A
LSLPLSASLPGAPCAHAESQKAPAGPAPLAQLLGAKLRAAVAEIDRGVDGVLGVAIVDLATGERILWNADHVFPTASAIKAPILLELLRQSQQAGPGLPGAGSAARLDDAYVPRSEDVIDGSAILAGLRFGATRLTNQDLATFMIAVSDNSATNVLIDRVGMAAVNATLAKLGLRETRLRRKMLDAEAVTRGHENTATPRELALFYERMYAGEVLDKAHREIFWNMVSLPQQAGTGILTDEIPEDVRVAHKPGSLDGARIDAGVVFVPGRPFVFSAFISYARDGRAAERTIAELARRTYEHFARLADSSPYGRRLPRSP